MATILGWASTPPVSVVPVHVKLLRLSTRAMLFPEDPAVLAVTVTTAPLDVAVTVAETLLLVAKVAPANDEQAFEPSAPAVGPDVHEKGTLVLLLTVSVEAVPGVTCVIVVVLVLDVAVTWVFEVL